MQQPPFNPSVQETFLPITNSHCKEWNANQNPPQAREQQTKTITSKCPSERQTKWPVIALWEGKGLKTGNAICPADRAMPSSQARVQRSALRASITQLYINCP